MKPFGWALLALSACTSENPLPMGLGSFEVEVLDVNGAPIPTRKEPLGANSGTSEERWHFRVQALDLRGNPMPWNGPVRISTVPGAVLGLEANGVEGRNLWLQDGKAEATARVAMVYGTSRLWVEDLGYDPAGPGQKPQCADKVNDDQDVLVDFPADPGCAYGNDMTEAGGSYVAGISQPIYYALPTVAEVQGTGSASPYPFESLEVKASSPSKLMVTRIARDGFYVTDVGAVCERAHACADEALPLIGPKSAVNPEEFSADAPQGCREALDTLVQEAKAAEVDVPPVCTMEAPNSLFAFTFQTPGNIRVCDEVTFLSGTLSEFFGFTELGFPSYKPRYVKDEDCALPNALTLPYEVMKSGVEMERFESSLARIGSFTVHVKTPEEADIPKEFRIPKYFGRKPAIGSHFAADQSNCDLNGDGQIDFDDSDGPEAACAQACLDDRFCTEWTSYEARGNYRVTAVDVADGESPVGDVYMQINTDAVPEFDPTLHRGELLRSVTGTLRNFSGGNLNWTVEVRCSDDLVCDYEGCSKEELPATKACLGERTGVDNEGTN